MAFSFSRYRRLNTIASLLQITGWRGLSARASRRGDVITCKAAVQFEPNKPFVIKEINVHPPRHHEVRIKIMAAGLCPSDLCNIGDFYCSGRFPIIRGHEGAGIVESVGVCVTKVKPGDHVIPIIMPQCNWCEYCLSGKTNLCSYLLETQGKGVLLDGSTRFKMGNDRIHHFMGTSTFSEYTVCEDVSVCKISKKAPLEKVCLLGCSIPTGYGAAVNSCKVTKGSSCAVFGLGPVGLAAAMGCKSAGASTICGIDDNEERGKVAKKFGVTDFINIEKIGTGKQLMDSLKSINDKGFDYTMECNGNANLVRCAFDCTNSDWGTSCIVGFGLSKDEVRALPVDLLTGRKWIGSAFGGFRNDDVARLVDSYMKKELMVDEFITHTMPLSEINEGLKMMLSGRSIKTVLAMSHESSGSESDSESDGECDS